MIEAINVTSETTVNLVNAQIFLTGVEIWQHGIQAGRTDSQKTRRNHVRCPLLTNRAVHT